MDDSKDIQHETGLQKPIQYLTRINSLISQVQDRISESFRKEEEKKLKSYKDNLLKTKEKFQKIHSNRNDENIRKDIFQYKKDLEKECTKYFQQEMETSKTYTKLKKIINSMNAQENQLKLQIQYLKKQCLKSELRGEELAKELNEVQNLYKEIQRKPLQQIKDNNLNGEKNNLKEQEKRRKTRENYFKETKKRLKNRMQGTKQYMDSLLFSENFLETNFATYNLEQVVTDKQKLKVIQQIFSKQQVKKQLHRLLF